MNKYEDKFGNKWNKKNLRKWIDACRDTEKFPQTSGALAKTIVVSADGDKTVGYCCLGVASKVSRCGTFVSEIGESQVWKFIEKSEKSEGGGVSYLPSQVMKWLGVKESDPQIDFGEGWTNPDEDHTFDYVSCASLNDGWGLTLPQIADMLEYFVYNNIPDA